MKKRDRGEGLPDMEKEVGIGLRMERHDQLNLGKGATMAGS